jgi:2-oxoglutarate ferredoxin oxidoreductase subunit delta
MAMSAPLTGSALRRAQGGPPSFRPVVVANERCKGCGLCIDACAPQALALDPTVVNSMGHHPAFLIHPEGCTSCAKCARMCPDAAISVFARPREA